MTKPLTEAEKEARKAARATKAAHQKGSTSKGGGKGKKPKPVSLKAKVKQALVKASQQAVSDNFEEIWKCWQSAVAEAADGSGATFECTTKLHITHKFGEDDTRVGGQISYLVGTRRKVNTKDQLVSNTGDLFEQQGVKV